MDLAARLRDHPRALDAAYRAAHRLLSRLAPRLARPQRAARWLRGPEELGKRWLFDCRMCGQCVLHETGMTCPMTCPKEIRNGPCGGVRADGGCEVMPARRCVWVDALRRGGALPGGALLRLQPPLDRRLGGRSAWADLLAGVERRPPPGWPGVPGRGS